MANALLLIFLISASCGTALVASRLVPQNDQDIANVPVSQNLDFVNLHEEWMMNHGRVYKTLDEKLHRFQIFKENVDFINAHNLKEERKFNMSVNRFADLTNVEFRKKYTGFRKGAQSAEVQLDHELLNVNLSSAPASVDWRKKGAVTPVKDQGGCGSCWAFSTVAAVEGLIKLKTGKLVSLSEQELIDCDVNGNNAGCLGGLMENAFEFIIKNKGLNTEAAYPYKGEDSTCNLKASSHAAATISGYKKVPANDEKALQLAVAKQPVSVAVDATYEFQFYSSGVFSGECDTYLNHAITAVGYDTATDGTKYWIMKNSWGKSWGENGYIRLERGVGASEGLCGLAMDASYPVA